MTLKNLKNYLIVPNQFWKHKNHLILVKAIKRLKDKKLKFKIVLTGDSKSQKDKTVFYKFISVSYSNSSFFPDALFRIPVFV